jgi:hypothetical protein
MNAPTLLRAVVLIVEICVIGVCAVTAVSIATEHGGRIWDASIVGAAPFRAGAAAG